MLTVLYSTSTVEVIGASCSKGIKKNKSQGDFRTRISTFYAWIFYSLHVTAEQSPSTMSLLAPAEATAVQPWGCLEFGTNQKHVGEVGAAHLPADEMPVGIDVQPGWLGETLPCVLKSLLMWIVAVQINSFFPLLLKTANGKNKTKKMQL